MEFIINGNKKKGIKILDMHIINIKDIRHNKRRHRMQEEYVKENKIKDKSKEEMNKMLIQSIINTNSNIQAAQKNYEFAEGELIDYYL